MGKAHSLAKAALAIQQEIGNQVGIPSANFGVGFVLLWHGDIETAMESYQTALHLAEQTGDVSLQARCLNYLAVSFRLRAQMEETRKYAERDLDVSTLAHMPEYIAAAKANLAWLAWRSGDLRLSQELCYAALELWQQLPAGQASTAFQWLARFPLIAVTLHEGKLVLAIDNMRALLDFNQQRLPETLVITLEQAIQAWDKNKPELGRSLIHQSITLAQEMHYL